MRRGVYIITEIFLGQYFKIIFSTVFGFNWTL